MALNEYGDISTLVNTIYQDAVFVARDNNVMSGLVTIFGDRTGAATRSLTRYGSVTMNEVDEADDLTSQAVTPGTIANLSPVEFAGQAVLTDLRVESDPFGARQDAAYELGMSMAYSIESNLISHFDEFSAGTIGNAGSVLTWAYFYAMYTALRSAKAPLPYVFVCNPNQYYRLGKATGIGQTATNAPDFTNKIANNFYVDRASGVDMYVSAYCEASSGSGYYAGMFSRSALALDIRRAPRLEYQRDASRRAWELNMSAVFAHGVWRKEWGVCGNFIGSAVDGTS